MFIARPLQILVSAVAALALGGCAATKPKMADTEFAPIVQIPEPPPASVTGSIYNGGP